MKITLNSGDFYLGITVVKVKNSHNDWSIFHLLKFI